MNNLNRPLGKKVAVCWSGGKDCCLALYRCLKEKDVVCLLSMVSEKDARNHAHGLPLEVLQLQAQAFELPLMMVDSAGNYEQSLLRSLIHLKKQYDVEAIVFGSLYSEEDRNWNEQIAMRAGLEPIFPVWISKSESSELLSEFISLGFKAIVCRASQQHFDRTWVGRTLDRVFFEEIHKTDSCVMGEAGEYHTFVLDGPITRKRIEITRSTIVLDSGLWSLDIQECKMLDKNNDLPM
jgi:diphthine-ammonia ligase